MSLPERHEATPPIGVEFHEYANVFPMLQGEALAGLREDISRHGVREPVVFMGDAILDGRNRYMCARELGIEYPRREFGSQPSDGDDPLSFVISHNLTRRHLTESQRASAAARLANMRRGGDRRSDQTANLQDVSRADAARMLNVSERSVNTARRVHDDAPPEIAQAVDDGRMSVSLAGKVADLPDEAKAEVVAAPPEQVREVARDVVRKAHVANNSGNNEWYTPVEFIEAAKAVLGAIALDPASSEIANRTVGAARFFTAEDDGLSQEWPGGSVWMNPPYAQPLIGQFCEKLATECEREPRAAIVLVNNATETGWFQRLASVASAMCFPKGRVRFLDPEGNPGAPLQGQAIVYTGPEVDAFTEHFSAFGFVLRHG